MTPERLKQIASWISDDPDFYLMCTEREATDAIKDLLTLTSEQATEILGLKAQHENRTPTQWAYEQVCAANEAKRAEVERQSVLLKKAESMLGGMLVLGYLTGSDATTRGLHEQARAVLSELQLKGK